MISKASGSSKECCRYSEIHRPERSEDSEFPFHPESWLTTFMMLERLTLRCSPEYAVLRPSQSGEVRGATKCEHGAILRLPASRTARIMSASKVHRPGLGRKPAGSPESQRTPEELETALHRSFEALVDLVHSWGSRSEPASFKTVEMALIAAVFALGRAAVELFLGLREQTVTTELPNVLERNAQSFRRRSHGRN